MSFNARSVLTPGINVGCVMCALYISELILNYYYFINRISFTILFHDMLNGSLSHICH